MARKRQGSLVAHETGPSNLYGLVNVQDRGVLFISPPLKFMKAKLSGKILEEMI